MMQMRFRPVVPAFLLVLRFGSASGQVVPAHLSPAAHAQTVAAFQQELNAEYRDPARTPLPAKEQARFKGLPFFPADYSYYVEARLLRDSTSAPFTMKTTTLRQPRYRKYGELHFVLQGQALKLNVYESLDLKQQPGYEDYLFLPLTDPTNGHGSYGGGRYLDLRIPAGRAATLWLDFNRAYNPFCAYSPQYSCPIPPPENHLPLPIRAGVQSDH
jgi:uncharacterized protein (DUF1684 family)